MAGDMQSKAPSHESLANFCFTALAASSLEKSRLTESKGISYALNPNFRMTASVKEEVEPKYDCSLRV